MRLRAGSPGPTGHLTSAPLGYASTDPDPDDDVLAPYPGASACMRSTPASVTVAKPAASLASPFSHFPGTSLFGASATPYPSSLLYGMCPFPSCDWLVTPGVYPFPSRNWLVTPGVYPFPSRDWSVTPGHTAALPRPHSTHALGSGGFAGLGNPAATPNGFCRAATPPPFKSLDFDAFASPAGFPVVRLDYDLFDRGAGAGSEPSDAEGAESYNLEVEDADDSTVNSLRQQIALLSTKVRVCKGSRGGAAFTDPPKSDQPPRSETPSAILSLPPEVL